MSALGFGRFGYTVILPSMQAGLSLTIAQTGDLAASNMTGYLVLAVLGGVAASRFGERRVIVVSLFLVGTAMFVTGVAGSYRIAFLGRFLTGLGSGGANVPIMGVLAVWYSRERRGFASGIAVSGSSFGLLLTGLLLPPLIRAGGAPGWRYAWYLLAAGAFVIAIVAAFGLRDRVESTQSQDQTGPGERDRPTKNEWLGLFRTNLIWILSVIYFAFGFSYVIYATFFSRALVGVAGYFVSALLFSLTAWSIPAVMAAAAGDIVGPRLASAAFGLVTLVFGFGQILGPLTAGRLVEASGAYASPFLLASAVAICGGVGALICIPNRLIN